MGATFGEPVSTGVKNYERIEDGSYPARCIQVVELGTHDTEYQGEAKKRKEILIVWELSELMEDGRPFVAHWRGTQSRNEKSKLYDLLTKWRGKKFSAQEWNDFMPTNILDKCCLLSVSKNTSKAGKEFNRVEGAVPLPKGMTCIDRVNDIVDFGIKDIGGEEWGKLYPWVQKIVLESDEGKRYNSTGDAAPMAGTATPFKSLILSLGVLGWATTIQVTSLGFRNFLI